MVSSDSRFDESYEMCKVDRVSKLCRLRVHIGNYALLKRNDMLVGTTHEEIIHSNFGTPTNLFRRTDCVSSTNLYAKKR